VKWIIITLFVFPGIVLGDVTFKIDIKESIKTNDREIAKKMILFRAAQEAAKKMAPDFSITYDVFKTKLDEKFKIYIERYQARKISEKFGSNYGSSLTPEAKKDFIKSLTINEADLFQDFSGHLNTIKTYQLNDFKNVENSSDEWQASVVVDIDKGKLEKVFKRVLESENVNITKIYLISDVEAYSFSWQDMNLSDVKTFLDPINQSWIQWMKDNYSQHVDEVKICDQKCLYFYQEWMKAPVSQVSIPLEFIDSHFLRIDFDLKKIKEDSLINEVSYSWEGRAVLQDINTKRVRGSFSLPLEKRVFRSLDQKALNSALASNLYRAPLTALLQLKNALGANEGALKVAPLTLRDVRHLGDVLSFIEILKNRGSSLGLDLSLVAFNKNEAFLTCFYRGEEKSFSDLLSGLKELKLSHPYLLMGEFSGVNHTIKFVTESP